MRSLIISLFDESVTTSGSLLSLSGLKMRVPGFCIDDVSTDVVSNDNVSTDVVSNDNVSNDIVSTDVVSTDVVSSDSNGCMD